MKQMLGLACFLTFSFAVIAQPSQPGFDAAGVGNQKIPPLQIRQQMTTEQQRERRANDRKRFIIPLDVQTWVLKGKIPGQIFAPSLVDRPEGGLRLYANSPQFKGIASYVSDDGLHFTPEAGLRLTSSFAKGDLDCVISHPWALSEPQGVRLYYQANAECERRGDLPPPQKSGEVSRPLEPIYRIMSAFSADGVNFKKDPGVRVDIGENAGLKQAAHGRAIELPDGTKRLFFSADFLEKGPTAIQGASSQDGLVWTLDKRPILNEGHDPTVVAVDGKFLMFVSHKMDMLVLESHDGYRFFPMAWVDFEGTNGEIVGDVDLHRVDAPDGQHLYLYGHFKGSEGIGIFEQKL